MAFAISAIRSHVVALRLDRAVILSSQSMISIARGQWIPFRRLGEKVELGREKQVGQRHGLAGKIGCAPSSRESSSQTACAFGMAAAIADSSGVSPTRRGPTMRWKVITPLTP